MGQDFKRTLIRLLAFTPEASQGTPNYVFEASGGTGTTVTLSTSSVNQHNSRLASFTPDFFNELYVYFKSNTTTSALQGKFYKISDSARVTTTVTLTTSETMAATPASGDIFYVFAPLQASNVSINVGKENLSRAAFERLTLDPPSSNKGLSVVSGSFDLEFWGLEQENGSGDTPRPDRLSRFLEAIGSQRRIAGTTVSGSGSTTTVVDVTSAASLQEGDYVMINGEVRRVTAVDTASTPDNITVSPALSSAPSDTTEVFVGEITTPYDSGHQSHTILHYRDSQLVECHGCLFSVSIKADFAQNISLSCEFDAEDFAITDDLVFDGIQSEQKTLPYIEGETFFGSTELCANSVNFTLNHGRQTLRDSCVGQRVFVTSRDAMLQVIFRNKDATPKNTWEANGTKDWVLSQIGNSAGDAVAFAGYAQIQDPVSLSDVEGHEFYDVSYGFRDDQDSSTARKPLLLRF